MHRLLKRQLGRTLGEEQLTALAHPAWQAFIKLVDDAYQAADADRELTERSMDIASKELVQRNDELIRNNLKLERAERELRKSHEELECRVAERTVELRAAIGLAEAARRDLADMNAQLETRVLERTEELHRTHKRLVELARQAGMAEVATDVLHNVGNVLNSVNVSVTLVDEKVRQSAVVRLGRAMDVLREHQHDLPRFLQQDQRGQRLPGYLLQLAGHLSTEQADILSEVTSLSRSIEHIKQIVAMQQSLAHHGGMLETVRLADVLEDAIRIVQDSLDRHGVTLTRDFAPLDSVVLDKHRLVQVVVNLLSNAKNAVAEGPRSERTITVHAAPSPAPHRLQIQVTDNGVGIDPENITRIFTHGFTTRKDGHGFGLHSAANIIAEMGGTIHCHSDGLGHGAVFSIELPTGRETPV
jgi:signal transduction histidine kinase